jgi:hypothetical protein
LTWCSVSGASHITDADLVAFLKRSQRALRKGGAIGVKENVCDDGDTNQVHSPSITVETVHYKGWE